MRAVPRRLCVAAALLCGWSAPSFAAPPPPVAPPAVAWAAPPADVERVSFERDGDRTRVVRIHLSSPVEAFSVDGRAGRVDVVLDGAHLAPTVREEGAEWPVQSYRAAAEADRVTITFRIEDGVRVRAAQEPGSDDLLLSFATSDAPARRVAGWGVVRDRPDRASAAERPRTTFGSRPAPAPRGRTETSRAGRGEALPEPVRPDLPPAAAPRPEAEPTRTAPTPRRTARPAPPARSEPARTESVRTEPARTERPTAEPAAPPRPMPTVEPAPAQVREPVAAGDLEAEALAEAPIQIPNAARWRLDTVVLDAGHGGHDYGARANGTSDKEVAWGVVSRLGPMLERELGVRVVYTRDDDTFVELRERGRRANRASGKLFISVHANAAGSTSARGTETFFLSASKSASARAVMERENSVIELESQPELYEDFDDEGDILQAMAMSAYQEESQALAGLIEAEFVADGRKSRGVKQGPFLVLWAASMPAVLVETGFITNRDEARYLSSDAGLDATAEAIFRAVRTYKRSYERGLRPQGG